MPFANTKSGFMLEKESRILINRTGGALVRGDLIALNLDFAATAGQAMTGLDPGTETDAAGGYILSAAIVPTAANACGILAVLDQDALADNAAGLFCFRGYVPVGCESGVAAGDFITAYSAAAATAIGTHATRTNAGTVTGFTRAELDSAEKPTGILGIAFEATSSETTAMCLFDGYAYRNMIGGGA